MCQIEDFLSLCLVFSGLKKMNDDLNINHLPESDQVKH